MYNVLAITCHPDDMEIHACGTLLRCKERGDNVTVCHVANGNMGHVVIEADELRDIRAEEARASGRIGGFNVVTCDVGDLRVNSADREQHDKIVKVIRGAQRLYDRSRGGVATGVLRLLLRHRSSLSPGAWTCL